MALPVWPANLPQRPSLPEGSQRPFAPPAATEMEDGPARQRRQATASWTDISFQYRMSAAQFAVLEAWIRDTLQHGAAAFQIPAWRPGAACPYPLKTARFQAGQTYSWRPVGAVVIVTLPLRILDF